MPRAPHERGAARVSAARKRGTCHDVDRALRDARDGGRPATPSSRGKRLVGAISAIADERDLVADRQHHPRVRRGRRRRGGEWRFGGKLDDGNVVRQGGEVEPRVGVSRGHGDADASRGRPRRCPWRHRVGRARDDTVRGGDDEIGSDQRPRAREHAPLLERDDLLIDVIRGAADDGGRRRTDVLRGGAGAASEERRQRNRREGRTYRHS